MTDDLDTRVRAGLGAVVTEAGDPPPMPTPGDTPLPSIHGNRRPLLAAAVLLAVAAIAGSVVFAVARDGGGNGVHNASTAPEPEDRPLLGTSWWLVAARSGLGSTAKDIAVPTEGTPWFGLRFSDQTGCTAGDDGCANGLQMAGSDACNGFQRRLSGIEDGVIRNGLPFGATTDMACTGPLPDLLHEFFLRKQFQYEIDGDELVLIALDGDRLTYDALDGPFGPTSSPIIDDGTYKDVAYRVVRTPGGLDFQTAMAKESIAMEPERGVSGVGDDPGKVNAMRGDVAERPYLFGVIPGNTTRAVYEPEGSEPVELEIHDLPGDDFAAVAQFIDAAPATWQLVAYDSAGNEIDRLRWGA